MRLALIAITLLIVACGGEHAAIQPSAVADEPGPLADTWTSDGVSWHRASTTGPSARYLAALAYDAARYEYVLFGGQTAKGSSDETWTWNGNAWKLMQPVHKPAPRFDAAMAYDQASHLIVLYGGSVFGGAEVPSAEGSVGDTWTWNGADWTELDQGPGPPKERRGADLVSAEGHLILFGGYAGNIAYYGDAWSWDGHAWSSIDKSPRPPGRGDAAAAWDPDDSVLLVYGGIGFNSAGGPAALGTPLSDLWSLTGRAWAPLSGGPGSLANASAMWDARAKRLVVLLGIACPNPSRRAWAWEGKSWSQIANPGMSPRWGAALAQAPDGQAVLFGGSNQAGC